MIVGVVGGSSVSGEILELAEELGAMIARQGYILMTGGGPGVMKAASRGAYNANGLVIGILPTDKNQSDSGYPNKFINIPIYTALSDARNVIIAKSPHVVIALSGGYGTLSEIALALKNLTPVIAISCCYSSMFQNDSRYIDVNTVREALEWIKQIIKVTGCDYKNETE